MNTRLMLYFASFVLSVALVVEAHGQSLSFECDDGDGYYPAASYNPPQPIGNVNAVIIYAVFNSPPSPPFISY